MTWCRPRSRRNLRVSLEVLEGGLGKESEVAPTGEQICVATRGEGAPAAVAVSELEQPVLLEALAQVAN